MGKRLPKGSVLASHLVVVHGGGLLSMQFKTSRAARHERWLSGTGVIARFLRESRAVAAVEFGLIAAPFIALLLAILEVGLVFVAQQVLQTATTQASRLILTGQAQSQNMSAAQFQQAVCNQATSLFSCAGIYVNVQKYSSFSSVSMSNYVSNGNFNNGAMQYTPGGPGDIVVVQVFYKWPVYTGPLNFNLSNVNGGYDLLIGTAAFRTEPYG
jgi:Flp pilus assembly protein TadG